VWEISRARVGAFNGKPGIGIPKTHAFTQSRIFALLGLK
jgi:hypothetical protein